MTRDALIYLWNHCKVRRAYRNGANLTMQPVRMALTAVTL